MSERVGSWKPLGGECPAPGGGMEYLVGTDRSAYLETFFLVHDTKTYVQEFCKDDPFFPILVV